MGFLSFIPFLGRGQKTDLSRLPSGTFTMDSAGSIVSSTLPQSVSSEQILEIGRCVLQAFKNARKARISVLELHIQYCTLKVTAREMKGSAVVFIMPQTLEESSY